MLIGRKSPSKPPVYSDRFVPSRSASAGLRGFNLLDSDSGGATVQWTRGHVRGVLDPAAHRAAGRRSGARRGVAHEDQPEGGSGSGATVLSLQSEPQFIPLQERRRDGPGHTPGVALLPLPSGRRRPAGHRPRHPKTLAAQNRALAVQDADRAVFAGRLSPESGGLVGAQCAGGRTRDVRVPVERVHQPGRASHTLPAASPDAFLTLVS
jgi:hypothetical protein